MVLFSHFFLFDMEKKVLELFKVFFSRSVNRNECLREFYIALFPYVSRFLLIQLREFLFLFKCQETLNFVVKMAFTYYVR